MPLSRGGAPRARGQPPDRIIGRPASGDAGLPPVPNTTAPPAYQPDLAAQVVAPRPKLRLDPAATARASPSVLAWSIPRQHPSSSSINRLWRSGYGAPR